MNKFNNFLNETLKIKELNIGDYIIFDKNLLGYYYIKGQMAILDSVIEKESKKFYLFKFEKPNDLNNYIGPLDKNFEPITQILISQPKVTSSTTILSDNMIKDWRLSKLMEYQVSDKLNKIINDISLDIKYKFIDISFIDILDDSDDTISFLPVSKFKKENVADPYNNKYRQVMKVSKFFIKLNPNLSTVDMENLVKEYKYEYNKIYKSTSNKFEIVTGEGIRYWYYHLNYSSKKTGTLWGSCMRHEQSQKRFNIYCDNPDKCSMAIYKDDEGKLAARALIWKLDDGKIYMDRIYSIDDTHGMVLSKYAKDNKMLTYERNAEVDYTVQLNKNYGSPYHNPYMDTFKYFDFIDYQLKTMLEYKYKYNTDIRGNRYYNYVDHD